MDANAISARKGETTPQPRPVRTLAIDIGATGIKAVLLNEKGDPISERQRIKTPGNGMPGAVLDAVTALAQEQGEFDRVSVGFPGVVHDGIVKEAPNLAEEWKDFNLAHVLEARLKHPVRVANDADIQGFGAISGVGVELVLTLGTGVGSALFVDGRLVPNVEVGRRKLSDADLQKVGKKRWNKRLKKAIAKLDTMFHFDRLYVGGGNSRHVDVAALPANVTIVSNLNGLIGGIGLWERPFPQPRAATEPSPPRAASRAVPA